MRWWILAVAGVAALTGTAGAPPTSIPAPPQRVSATGLYVSGSLAIDPRCRPYSPQYPLWSDGAGKSRWIYLPEGSKIGAADDAAWEFPVGTKLWKEFAFGGRRVETRMLWRSAPDTWVFAAYVWNDDQTDAVLAPPEGLRGVAEVAPGKRHDVPALADCRTCHEGGRSTVLAFTALELSTDRDPLAPHAEPLAPGMVTDGTLVEEGLLAPPRPDLVATPPRIRARSPRERAVLGYLATNCGTCHNADGPLAFLGLALGHAPSGPEPALRSAVGVPGRWAVPGLPPGATRRLAPGEPAASSILYRMRSRRPSSQMPPLGTVLVDEDAASLVGRFIAEDLAPAR